jgi:hypothetical protein
MGAERSIARRMDAPTQGGGLILRNGDVIATIEAYGSQGIPPALQSLLHQFPQGFRFDVVMGGLRQVPVHENGDAEPKPPSKLLVPPPAPGIVGAEPKPQQFRMVPIFTIIAIASGVTQKQLPTPSPLNDAPVPAGVH